METLQIQIPEGFRVASFDTDTGLLKFEEKPKSLRERMKTFADICAEAGETLSDYITSSTRKRDIFLMQVKRITLIYEVFQQGSTIDPNDKTVKKWRTVFDLEKGPNNPSGFRFNLSYYTFSITYSILGPLLWVDNEEDSNYIGRAFEDEFRKAIII